MPEAAKASVNKVWAKWESQVVNGIFPLRRFLDQSDHSVVFLTECRAQQRSEAAIKIIPADPMLAETQLSHWKMATNLAHPHLIRLFDAGRCHLGGYPFLFVVMELADQTLAQVLPKRALTPDEVREMLAPTLEALGYLHERHLVQGQLKPTNVLVVGEQLKLASDTVRPVAKPSGSIAKVSVYDAPESRDGKITVAGDIWGLGATLLEALTQSPPPWPGDRSEPASLLPSVPTPDFDLVRRCLSRSAGSRPTLAELEAWLSRTPGESLASSSPAPLPGDRDSTSVQSGQGAKADQAIAAQHELALTQSVAGSGKVLNDSLPLSSKAAAAPVNNDAALIERDPAPIPSITEKPDDEESRYSRLPVSSIVVFLAVLIVGWAALQMFHGQSPGPETPAPLQTAPMAPVNRNTGAAMNADARTTAARAAPRSYDPSSSVAASAPAVLHEEIPVISASARETIQGRIKVAVRVTVDRSGNVVSEAVETPGPSKYFVRLATDAARKWKFAPGDARAPHEWLLRFEFSRAGATAHGVPRT